ncbi:MAG: peptidoglycan endopeptidase [Spirochaetaceae bacterium]|nr:peptidoglycan endopeptidase [Spirochaetaceae bacterium]
MFLLTGVPSGEAAGESAGPEEGDQLSAFADPSRIWGGGIEGLIEEAYRLSFKTYIIGGRVMNLRIPFAQNNERDELAGQGWEFWGGGKADPPSLWGIIGGVLEGEDFARYVETLSDGREKVIIFDIPTRTWTSSRDPFDIARMKAGAYRGLPHRPYVLVSGRGIGETDVYNFLYCVGWVGMDCSGFVWQVLSYIARAGGLDLGRMLRRALRLPRNRDPFRYVGTGFFNSGSREVIAVPDEIRRLRPADILLFRGADGGIVHSAIIQSVDREKGLIRYLQSTDEAPPAERGAHESFIRFDPEHPELSLKDPSVIWTQSRYPPFPGEKASPFSDDGERYRAYPDLGGGRVVRLRALAGLSETINRR